MIPGSANPLLLAPAGGGYQVERSLRFNSSDSAYLSRTPSTAGNRKTWTWAGWVKRSGLTSSRNFLFGCGPDGNDFFGVEFSNSSDALIIQHYAGGTQYLAVTTQVFRDASAWFHLAIALDTTQATNTDRVKAYVNGERVTAFSTYSTWPQNLDANFNRAATTLIGRLTTDLSFYFNGYLADIHFIDGQALTPSSFTEVSATTGQLIPKAYTGSFGTNGFWLKFSDNSAATATTLGKDYSGNSNNWTPNNLSVTAGAGNDSLVDTPTSYGTDTGAGGEVRGNYCTWNPLSGGTLANGNLDVSGGSAVKGTVSVFTGKWYYEFTLSTNVGANPNLNVGVIRSNATSSGFVYDLGNALGALSGDVIGVALDVDAGKFWIAKNGTWVGSGNPGTGANATISSITLSGDSLSFYNSPYNAVSYSANFGQRAFAYTNNRSGFKALCDTNLPAPLVALPNTVFNVALDTGANILSAAQGLLTTGTDWIWIKDRANSNNHQLIDTVRGGTLTLQSNTTAAETTYTAPAGSSVAWCWDAGSSTVSNTQGSITSQVRANVSAGFSVVKYPNVGSTNSTIGHGLGVAPKLLIVRYINQGSGWFVYHADTGAGKYLELQSTGSATTLSSLWNNTAPTSTVFSVGTAWTSSIDNIAYCFAPVVGYSSALAWTGNGSADGPLLHCGFLPRFFIAKRTDSANDWWMWDTARSNTGNPVDEWLSPNRSDAEYPNDADFDFLSNGIKIRTSSSTVNASAGTYIGFAWASNPFQYARAQ